MGGYNAMDSCRCIDAVLQYVLGTRPVQYTSEVHKWMSEHQSSKIRAQHDEDMRYFGIRTARDMQKQLCAFHACVLAP